MGYWFNYLYQSILMKMQLYMRLILKRMLTDSIHSQLEPYASVKKASLMYYAYRSKLFSGPSAVTKCISRAVNSRRPRCRYNPGRGAGMLLFWHAILPARAWDALNRMAVKIK